jgi:hypothetical protein
MVCLIYETVDELSGTTKEHATKNIIFNLYFLSAPHPESQLASKAASCGRVFFIFY